MKIQQELKNNGFLKFKFSNFQKPLKLKNSRWSFFHKTQCRIFAWWVVTNLYILFAIRSSKSHRANARICCNFVNAYRAILTRWALAVININATKASLPPSGTLACKIESASFHTQTTIVTFVSTSCSCCNFVTNSERGGEGGKAKRERNEIFIYLHYDACASGVVRVSEEKEENKLKNFMLNFRRFITTTATIIHLPFYAFSFQLNIYTWVNDYLYCKQQHQLRSERLHIRVCNSKHIHSLCHRMFRHFGMDSISTRPSSPRNSHLYKR